MDTDRLNDSNCSVYDNDPSQIDFLNKDPHPFLVYLMERFKEPTIVPVVSSWVCILEVAKVQSRVPPGLNRYMYSTL